MPRTIRSFPVICPLSFTNHSSFENSLDITHFACPEYWPPSNSRASFFLQLSPEEGYVSAKEDSFFYTAQSFEEEGPADSALFHAELALVSAPFLTMITCANL